MISIVHKLVQRCQTHHYLTKSEMMDIGVVAFWRANSTYDPSKGSTLISHVHNQVHRELWKKTQRCLKQGKQQMVSIDVVLDEIQEPVGATTEDRVDWGVFLCLEADEQNMIVDHYGIIDNCPMTIGDMATKYRLNGNLIRRRLTKIQRKLRRGYCDVDI